MQQYVESRQAAPTDPTAWQPVFAATLARETHVSDLTTGQPSAIQVNFSYSDGFGREIQQKQQADPGPVTEGGPVVSPRWVGSGWTIFNNKGKPVRKYEPFFSALPAEGHRFEFGVQVGVSSIVCYDSAGRSVATVHPNQTWEKVVFDPWHQQLWDVNDTVLVADPTADADVGGFFARLVPAETTPTWHQQRSGGALGPQEQAAATKAAAHANTPATNYFDALGRTMLTVTDNAAAGKYSTHTELDIQGYQRSMTDALSRQAVTYDYDLLGTHLHQASMEAGQRWMLKDVSGKSIRSWDSRGHNRRATYDALRRLLNSYVLGTDAANSDPRTLAAEVCYESVVYGEGQADAQTLNLCTRVFQQWDVSGLNQNMALNPATKQQEAFDFKGNLLRGARQFVTDPKALTDWSGAAPPMLPAYVTSTRYDALNRATALTSEEGSVTTPTYNERNALKAVSVNLRGAAASTGFVTGIDYNAKGQRLQITFANAGTNTVYSYDPLTFRMIRLTTARPASPANQQTVQDLAYTFDPAGNITHMQDDADLQDTVFFRNRRVEPSSDYTYDAIYRLIEATGREQLGLAGGGGPLAPAPTSYNDVPRAGLLQPGDGNAMGIYDEQYRYDAAGNLLNFIHRGSDPANPGWSRSYTHNEASQLNPAQVGNRLSSSAVAGNMPLVENYSYDPHGNMTSMPQLQHMEWDFRDRLLTTQRQAVNASDADGILHQGQQTRYVYNTAGERTRKATFSAAGLLLKERFYLGACEIYREYDAAGNATLERQALHVRDDKQRIALVETVTIDAGAAPATLPATTQRYQFGNHLGTASLELDETAAVITYEEYYPFGSTSYQAGASVTQVSLKRYRYTAKEKDEETGLYYHGARYYAPWLGRWTSCDPAGVEDGLNLYAYVHDNPVRHLDPKGTQTHASDESCTDHGRPHIVAPPAAAHPPPAAAAQPQQPQPAVAAAAAPPADPPAPTEGAVPTSVYTSATAGSATARPGMEEREATGTLVVGGGGAGAVATWGVQAAVRWSLCHPFTGGVAPVRYGWDAGFVLGMTHGFLDSSRSGTLGATLRYGSGTASRPGPEDRPNPGDPPRGPVVAGGVALSATLNPSIDARGTQTYPFTANATGVLEIAAGGPVTIDLNAVAAATFGGGSTMFTGANLWNTFTAGGQLGVGINPSGHRYTFTPEALIYGTWGSGAAGSPGGALPGISSLRTGGGFGMSWRYGPVGIPSGVWGFQGDAFYEATRVGGTGTTGGSTVRGAGGVLNLGVTF